MKKKRLKKELNKTTDRAFEYMELCEKLRDENMRLESENENLKVSVRDLGDSAEFFVKKNSSLKQKLAKRKECCKKLNRERKNVHVDLSPISTEVPVTYSCEQIEKSRESMENAVEFTKRQEEADMLSERLGSVLKEYKPGSLYLKPNLTEDLETFRKEQCCLHGKANLLKRTNPKNRNRDRR